MEMESSLMAAGHLEGKQNNLQFLLDLSPLGLSSGESPHFIIIVRFTFNFYSTRAVSLAAQQEE